MFERFAEALRLLDYCGVTRIEISSDKYFGMVKSCTTIGGALNVTEDTKDGKLMQVGNLKVYEV